MANGQQSERAKTRVLKTTIGCLRGGRGRAALLGGMNHYPALTKVTVTVPVIDVPTRKVLDQRAARAKRKLLGKD